MITLGIALRKMVIGQKKPVVTEYDLFLQLRALVEAGEYQGQPIRKSSRAVDRSNLKSKARDLRKGRYLRPDPDFYPDADQALGQVRQHYKVFRVSDVPDGPAEDIAALVDPFCYVSHLSAMQRHGLTDRMPAELHITTPNPTLWSFLRDRKMEADYGKPFEAFETDVLGLKSQPMLRLERLSLPDVIRDRPLALHTTKYLAEVRPVRGTFTRVAAIGDVFMDMLDAPELCGGMRHVLEVWANEARPYLDDIICAADRHQSGIVKVRTGYLLETLHRSKDSRIEGWLKFAQRGSSRKLDASQPYLPTFSEKWMLSVNVDSEFLPKSA